MKLSNAFTTNQISLEANLNSKQDKSAVGTPNGVATLDDKGKIPVDQLPLSIPGAISHSKSFFFS